MEISTTNINILEIQGQSSVRVKIRNLNDKPIDHVYDFTHLRYYISRNHCNSFYIKLSNFKYMGAAMAKERLSQYFIK